MSLQVKLEEKNATPNYIYSIHEGTVGRFQIGANDRVTSVDIRSLRTGEWRPFSDPETLTEYVIKGRHVTREKAESLYQIFFKEAEEYRNK